jgi:hypothetical protein
VKSKRFRERNFGRWSNRNSRKTSRWLIRLFISRLLVFNFRLFTVFVDKQTVGARCQQELCANFRWFTRAWSSRKIDGIIGGTIFSPFSSFCHSSSRFSFWISWKIFDTFLIRGFSRGKGSWQLKENLFSFEFESQLRIFLWKLVNLSSINE